MALGFFVVDFDPDLFVEMGVDSLIFPFDTPKGVFREATKDFEVFVEFKPLEFTAGFEKLVESGQPKKPWISLKRHIRS
jgi:hypothetical protein